jgi:hypothetical protein
MQIGSHVTTLVRIGYAIVLYSHQPTFVRVKDQRCEKPDHFHEIIDCEVCELI